MSQVVMGPCCLGTYVTSGQGWVEVAAIAARGVWGWTGEVLSRHHIQPDKTYWRNQNNEPGRWPSPPNTRPMSQDT